MDQRQIVRRIADNTALSDFKTFLLKQNILSLAIAVVVGTALNGLVKALVDSFIMPIVGAMLPSGDWRNWTVDVGSAQFTVGSFLAALLNFLVIAFVAWRIARAFLAADAPPPTKTCDYCRMTMDPRATRCPHCTSQLTAAA
jgi:large conductance mechanosensitive channel